LTFLLNTSELRLSRLAKRVRCFTDLADGSTTGFWAMVTLTYAVDTWQPRHIADYLMKVRNWLKRRGHKFVYCWVAELQARGVPHYHILVRLPNKKTKLPKPDLSGMWRHGCSEIDWVYKSARNYMAKYCSKVSQRMGCNFARGMRLHGAGGLPPDARAWFRWLMAPQYVRHETEPKDLVKRTLGGYKVTLGGSYRFIPTPWIGQAVPGYGVRITRKSADRWNESAIDFEPHKTYLMRDNAFKITLGYSEYVERRWGEIIQPMFSREKD